MVADKVQLVTLQSDEKWFFCFVRRRFLKVGPYFGWSPVNHKVRHKSHIDKFMVFAMSAFVPLDSNWMKGGETFYVILQQDDVNICICYNFARGKSKRDCPRWLF